MGIAQDIKRLTEDYKVQSIQCMKNLCNEVGIQYREPAESNQLLADLRSKGYRAKVQKFSEQDNGVGQYIILTDLKMEFVKGYKVWIEFTDYDVYYREVTKDECYFLDVDGGLAN